ncbi:MAG: hypothetical protein AB4041_02120 [Microcystaceae cyanobacterium]
MLIIISNQDHDSILEALGQEEPDLFNTEQQSRENALRLESYRENLLETILRSWQSHPEQTHIATLLQAFSEQASHHIKQLKRF